MVVRDTPKNFKTKNTYFIFWTRRFKQIKIFHQQKHENMDNLENTEKGKQKIKSIILPCQYYFYTSRLIYLKI